MTAVTVDFDNIGLIPGDDGGPWTYAIDELLPIPQIQVVIDAVDWEEWSIETIAIITPQYVIRKPGQVIDEDAPRTYQLQTFLAGDELIRCMRFLYTNDACSERMIREVQNFVPPAPTDVKQYPEPVRL